MQCGGTVGRPDDVGFCASIEQTLQNTGMTLLSGDVEWRTAVIEFAGGISTARK